MTDLESLAKTMKELRKERGESQLAFAGYCDISIEEISLIERKRADPRLSTIRKIAEHVGRSVSDLIRPQEPPCTYCVKERELRDEDGSVHECYDIECREEGSGALVECASGIFFCFKDAFAFACLLNRHRLSRRHFRDVVEDLLVCVSLA